MRRAGSRRAPPLTWRGKNRELRPGTWSVGSSVRQRTQTPALHGTSPASGNGRHHRPPASGEHLEPARGDSERSCVCDGQVFRDSVVGREPVHLRVRGSRPFTVLAPRRRAVWLCQRTSGVVARNTREGARAAEVGALTRSTPLRPVASGPGMAVASSADAFRSQERIRNLESDGPPAVGRNVSRSCALARGTTFLVQRVRKSARHGPDAKR